MNSGVGRKCIPLIVLFCRDVKFYVSTKLSLNYSIDEGGASSTADPHFLFG